MPDELVELLERDAAALALREQERLGRQLHDTLGPQLTAISMLATSLHERLQCNSSQETALAAKLLDYVERAKVDVRTLAKGLVPVEIVAEGLMFALAELANETELTYGVRCRFECDCAVAMQDNFVATRLYRIAKEAVHNAIKHAQCTEIVIRLRDHDRLVMEIQDNGIGFSHSLEHVDGSGIRIMRFRCQLIGGQLNIHAGKDGGTVVVCSIIEKDCCDD